MASVTLDDPGCQLTRPPRLWVNPLVLAVLGGCVNVVLDLWLRPHGVGYVLVALASTVIALATGASEGVVPVPRVPDGPPVLWPPASLSLLCWLQQDRVEGHKVCFGTTDDGREAPCECWCHGE